jgi:hypothetical protein
MSRRMTPKAQTAGPHGACEMARPRMKKQRAVPAFKKPARIFDWPSPFAVSSY